MSTVRFRLLRSAQRRFTWPTSCAGLTVRVTRGAFGTGNLRVVERKKQPESGKGSSRARAEARRQLAFIAHLLFSWHAGIRPHYGCAHSARGETATDPGRWLRRLRRI